MEIELLIGNEVKNAIEHLMDEHNEFHWAVAWGTSTSTTQKLLSNSAKISAVTFGLAFAQSDPDLIDSLIGINGCHVVTKFPGGTFHPKVYAFRSGEQAAAIVGSANCTRGGLTKNYEACVLVKGSVSDKMLADTLSFATRSASIGERVTEELARRYRLGCKLAAKRPNPPRDPLAGVPPTKVKSLSSPLVGMDWGSYVNSVRGSSHHDFDKSLDLLRTAQAWLSAAPSFYDLKTPQRKAIAGSIGNQEKEEDQALNRDWGRFGSMRGAGIFTNRVKTNNRFLARAVDSIPQKGEVTREHFERFSQLFIKSFGQHSKVAGVATASRLLAMKRPDAFLCICKPNISGAARMMGFSETTLRLGNYWELVVEVIRTSNWYNIDKPENRDGPLWECRAAMLDAILFDSNKLPSAKSKSH